MDAGQTTIPVSWQYDMKIDINSLSCMHDFDLRTEALGQVHCGSVNDKMSSNLVKILMMSDVDGVNFSRQVLRLVGKKTVAKDVQGDSKVQWEEGLIEEEINQITDAEVKIFAKEFIAHNGWLLPSHRDREQRVIIKEKESTSHTPTTIDLSEGNAEGSTSYLVRLYRNYIAVQREQLQRLTKTEPGKSMQQLAYDHLTEATRYLVETSATSAIERIIKHDQDLMRAIDPFKDARSHIEEHTTSMAMDYFKREQDLLRAATSPFEDEKCYLAGISASAMMAKDIYRNMDLIRETTLGLAQKATSSAVIARMEKQQQEFRDLLKSHEAMFRLPQAFEAAHLLESYQGGGVAEFAQQHADRQRSLEAITTPWLHREEAARSVMAILELQGMGNALRTMKGFDPGFTTALRLDLGDWRDKITFPESVFIDPVARTDFYVNRGFKWELTDFPEAAFHQSLDLAGLDDASLDLELYGSVTPRSVDPEEAGLQRTNRCHDRLQRFERLLRQFIDKEMTARYGPKWPKKRFATTLYEDWKSKKEKAERNGGVFTFIEMADFMDYETIICKQDHWREVFEKRFKTRESVRESLQRLQPIRLTVAHSRIVTKDDELYFVLEIKRLLSAIK